MYAVLWLGDAKQGHGCSSSPGEMGCSEGLGLTLFFFSGTLLKTPISGVIGPRSYQKYHCYSHFFHAFYANFSNFSAF